MSIFLSAQKYVLLDKAMYAPITFTNAVTSKDEYKNLFPIEKDKLQDFIKALDKIYNLLSSKQLPQGFDFNIGKTRFFGLKLSGLKEERMDIVLTTNCDNQKFTMHLCDENVSIASNIFFVKTWSEYIKQNVKDAR